MATSITERNLSLAWLAALEHLAMGNGTDVAVTVTIEQIDEEIPTIGHILDEFVARRGGADATRICTVANTIFPESLYLPRLGSEARPHLYREHRDAYTVARREPANRLGTYFDRMVRWPSPRGEVNQLERVVTRLQGVLARRVKNGSSYELCVRDPADSQVIGFPCLSHVSLTLWQGRLHLTALYRNQHFIRKAYGNYAGLCRLLRFVCCEAGCPLGEVVCIASHADAEVAEFGKRELASLIDRCRVAAADAAPAISGSGRAS